MSGRRQIPAFSISPETRPFWDAAADGRFLIRRCRACGEAHWYPRPACPFCDAGGTEWVEASGRGTVYAFSAMTRAPEPYVIAYVTLDEGPTLVTNIVDCDPDAVAVGQAVRVVFVAAEDGRAVPMFAPAPALAG